MLLLWAAASKRSFRSRCLDHVSNLSKTVPPVLGAIVNTWRRQAEPPLLLMHPYVVDDNEPFLVQDHRGICFLKLELPSSRVQLQVQNIM